MKPGLEPVLKALDACEQAPNRHEYARLQQLYHAELEAAALALGLNRDTLHRMMLRYYPRWVRASLPTGFPKN
jgi:hypothetical protein